MMVPVRLPIRGPHQILCPRAPTNLNPALQWPNDSLPIVIDDISHANGIVCITKQSNIRWRRKLCLLRVAKPDGVARVEGAKRPSIEIIRGGVWGGAR